jgi:hypothetical protein
MTRTMTGIFLALLLLSLCGCNKPPATAFPAKPSALPPAATIPEIKHNYIHELKVYAKEHRLYYSVWCVDWLEEETYQANLCRADCSLVFANEGGKGMWIERGSTQEEAAQRVIKSAEEGEKTITYFDPPNFIPHNRQCKRPIKGGPE